MTCHSEPASAGEEPGFCFVRAAGSYPGIAPARTSLHAPSGAEPSRTPHISRFSRCGDLAASQCGSDTPLPPRVGRTLLSAAFDFALDVESRCPVRNLHATDFHGFRMVGRGTGNRGGN